MPRGLLRVWSPAGGLPPVSTLALEGCRRAAARRARFHSDRGWGSCGLESAGAGYIYLFHPHDGLKGALDVYVDDIRVARLALGKLADVNGSGQPQELIVRASGAGESPVR